MKLIEYTTNLILETTFSAKDRSVIAEKRNKNSDLARLQKEMLMARKKELDRQSQTISEHLKEARTRPRPTARTSKSKKYEIWHALLRQSV